MLKKLLMAAAMLALAPTGTALANESGRHGYGGGGGYYSGHYYGDRYRPYRQGHRLNRFDRQMRELRDAYRNGYISRSEYRHQRRLLERERRWYFRNHSRGYRDRRYGYRW